MLRYGGILLVSLACLLSARSAAAHPLPLEPVPATEPRDDGVQLGLRLAVTTMPIALGGFGAMDGGQRGSDMLRAANALSFGMPSPDELYSDHVFSFGMGARALGVSLLAYGPAEQRGQLVFLGGTALQLAGAALDLASSREDLGRWRHANRTRLQVSPVMLPGRQAPGLGLFGRF